MANHISHNDDHPDVHHESLSTHSRLITKEQLESDNVIDEYDQLEAFNPRLYSVSQESLEVIKDALNRWNLSQICFSFNGGKDSCVLLHLLLIACRKLGKRISEMKFIYFILPNSFSEVNDFVEIVSKIYGVNLIILRTSFKDGLKLLVEEHDMKAVFMGTRWSDPSSDHLKAFTATDEGWPYIMRVNPILQWDYSLVWIFIIRLGLPYCSLYDQGYTSIGQIHDTSKNPLLKQENGEYSPAFNLQDSLTERCGRAKKQ